MKQTYIGGLVASITKETTYGSGVAHELLITYAPEIGRPVMARCKMAMGQYDWCCMDLNIFTNHSISELKEFIELLDLYWLSLSLQIVKDNFPITQNA